MSYEIYVYAIMLFVSAFCLSGINFNNFFKKGHIIEAKIFVMMICLGLAYLASSFIIAFINAV